MRYTGLAVAALMGLGSTTSVQNAAAVVVGGIENNDSGFFAFVGSGYQNAASGAYSFIGNGYQNSASNSFDAVVDGAFNEASGGYSFVGSGFSNTAFGSASVVAGGVQNSAGNFASVLGGVNNNAGGNFSAIVGGAEHDANGSYSSILAGYDNRTEGDASSVLNGVFNVSGGHFSMTAGVNAQALARGAVVLKDSVVDRVTSSGVAESLTISFQGEEDTGGFFVDATMVPNGEMGAPTVLLQDSGTSAGETALDITGVRGNVFFLDGPTAESTYVLNEIIPVYPRGTRITLVKEDNDGQIVIPDNEGAGMDGIIGTDDDVTLVNIVNDNGIQLLDDQGDTVELISIGGGYAVISCCETFTPQVFFPAGQ